MDIKSPECLSILKASFKLKLLLNRKFEIYLYGSRVKGNAKKESDWDIAIKFLNENNIQQLWIHCGDTINEFMKEKTNLNTHVEFFYDFGSPMYDENSPVLLGIREKSIKIFCTER